MTCQTIQHELEGPSLDALSERTVQHLKVCTDCSAHHQMILKLTREAPHRAAFILDPNVMDRIERQARRALQVGHTQEHPVPLSTFSLPLVLAVLAFPLTVLQAWGWLRGMAFLSDGLLPDAVFFSIAFLYVTSTGMALGCLYFLIPIAIAYARQHRTETF